MEIKDLEKEKLTKELLAGDIVNCSGDYIMVTDIVNEEEDEEEEDETSYESTEMEEKWMC